MRVHVEHEELPQAVAAAQVEDGDRHVVEVTEAPEAVPARVVAGGPHVRKGSLRLPRNQGLRAPDDGSAGKECYVVEPALPHAGDVTRGVDAGHELGKERVHKRLQHGQLPGAHEVAELLEGGGNPVPEHRVPVPPEVLVINNCRLHLFLPPFPFILHFFLPPGPDRGTKKGRRRPGALV